MITIFIQTDAGIQSVALTKENYLLINNAIWIDLISPTRKEEKLVENILKIGVPTKKEMEEIEPSSRFYTEDNSVFMTATMVAQSDTPEPKTDVITFILQESKLITIRYIEPHSFKLFISRVLRMSSREYSPIKLLVGLIESTADRLADILEKVSHNFDEVSHLIFHSHNNDTTSNGIDYKKVLQNIGSNGDLGTKVRESLVSFSRLISFLEQNAANFLDEKLQSRLKIANKDFSALSDYASFISSKVSFLLDATLGMVNIEQNNIIKIFSVAAVIFLPPTLIASIYGMNFAYMPELHSHIGYPIAIVLMLISAWLPYSYFKKRKWL